MIEAVTAGNGATSALHNLKANDVVNDTLCETFFGPDTQLVRVVGLLLASRPRITFDAAEPERLGNG